MAPRARFHPELLSLASGSWVSLLPRREDMQIPLRVSCQDFFWDVPNYSLGICRRSWTVFILHCYFGESAVPCLFSPCFFSLFSLFGIQRLSMAGERLINILPAAPGRVLGAGVVFLVRPLCCIVTGAELRALRRRSGSSFGHLTSMIYLPQQCSWGCSLLFRTCLAK